MVETRRRDPYDWSKFALVRTRQHDGALGYVGIGSHDAHMPAHLVTAELCGMHSGGHACMQYALPLKFR